MDPVTLTPTHRFPAGPRFSATTSPLRSPTRRQHLLNLEKTSLLSDLSPFTTLEALQTDDLVRTGDKDSRSFIQQSAASASTLERAWGIKAALAGKRVQEWYAEIGSWIWPGFDQSPLEEPIDGGVQQDQENHIERSFPSEAARSNGRYITGKQNAKPLSSNLIREYEERMETIREELDTLEIEDLKNYVRHTHYKAGSRRSSLQGQQGSPGLATDYDYLDDFTAIITATIMQALPKISRLESLLNTWSTRLLVLRQVPSFLVDLNSGQESMVSASIAIGAYDSQYSKPKSEFSWKAFLDIRAVLQDQIAELGRNLDRMLDRLEGSADILPDAWIESLDSMENQYSDWVVQAERLAMNRELKNERLEKDYTMDRGDEALVLDGPLDIGHTAPTLDTSAHLDEVRRRADGDFDLTLQNPTETLKTENPATDSSRNTPAESSDLESLPSRGPLPENDLSEKVQPRGSKVNSAESRLLDGVSAKLLALSSASRPYHRPTPLVLAGLRDNMKRPDSSDTVSDSSVSYSPTSNYSSNKSSPEIQSAIVAEYMGSPVRVTSPTFNKDHTTAVEIARRRLGPPAKGYGTKVGQSGVMSDTVPKNERRKLGSWHFRTRRASLQPFEVVPKHEIKRIQVHRTGSYSSALSLSDPEYGRELPSGLPFFSASQPGGPETLRNDKPIPASKEAKDQRTSALVQNLDAGHDTSKQQSLYHPPPPVSGRPSSSAQSPVGDSHPFRQQLPYHPPPAVPPGPALPTQDVDLEPDTAEDQLPYHSPPPVLPRPAYRFEEVSDLSPGSTPIVIRQMNKSDMTSGHAVGPVQTPQKAGGKLPKNLDDQLEQRISSILTELPTQIRLTSGPEPDAPEVTPPPAVKTPKARLPAWRLKRTQASTALPSMTLAPAQPKSSSSRSPNAEPDIKLYHLHQAGKTAPIKLFVRLVGEGGERVMVRIGGGWADLGEYLREYAGHHGRRSVSDSPFDITGLPSSSPMTNNNHTPRSRPGSRPISPPSAKKPSPTTTRHARQQTSPAIITGGPQTPHSDPPTRDSPRMSWAGAAAEEVSPSLGLAGPKTKNVDISPRKQAWVEEMMEQARQGGGEKKGGGGEGAVGDLGKVGRTRRVFFRNRKEV